MWLAKVVYFCKVVQNRLKACFAPQTFVVQKLCFWGTKAKLWIANALQSLYLQKQSFCTLCKLCKACKRLTKLRFVWLANACGEKFSTKFCTKFSTATIRKLCLSLVRKLCKRTSLFRAAFFTY